MKILQRLPRTNLSPFLWRLWGDSIIAQNIIVLGIPIIIGQLGSIAQQFADTIMVGQYGTMELAAAGFVNNIFNFVIYFILGISYASTPIIGAAFGRKDRENVIRNAIDSVILNLLCGVGVSLLLLLLYANIEILGQPREILPVAQPYFLILTASVPFMSVFNALKQFSDAIGETRIPMWIMLISNVLNILLNWWLIFGADMGLKGAGIATLVSRIFMVMALLAVIMKNNVFLPYRFSRNSIPSLAGMKYMFLLGVPISIQLGLEASSFNMCAIFMGWIGAIPLAAHQVMCTISTLCFQIVYGIGAAASVMISQFRGVGDWHNVQRTARSAFGIGLTTIIIMIGIIYILRYPLVLCFTGNDQVIALVIQLFPCFFIYQFGDCMQITYANALRGIEQVRWMMMYAFVSYVIVSIPASYICAFILNYDAVGVWMGMPFGLTTAGILFYREFRKSANLEIR